MPKRNESLLDILVMAPWWISLILAGLVHFALTVIVPAKFANDQIWSGFAQQIANYAWIFSGFFLMAAVFSFIFSLKRKSLVNRQTGRESLQELSWKEFEWMVGEAYRRQGYAVEESLGGGPDGGVDLVLRKDGRKILVQCKRWKKYSVGAPIIRELYGLLVDQKANEAILVTSGKFTREAEAFAKGKPLQLVDGDTLSRLVAGLQKGGAQRSAPTQAVTQDESVPTCPKCGAPMVLRTAKRGKNVGQSFYGCSSYPKCRGTMPIAPFQSA